MLIATSHRPAWWQSTVGLTAVALVVGTLAGCKGNSSVVANNFTSKSCPVLQEKTAVQKHMLDTYLWADYVQPVDVNAYASSQSLLDTLAIKNTRVGNYSITDKWSYIASMANVDKLQKEGSYQGYGYMCYYTQPSGSDCMLAFVYPNSPMASVGLQRGDTLVEQVENQNNTLTIKYAKAADGVVKTATLSPANVTVKTLLTDTIITTAKHKIGYLVFQSFNTPSNTELTDLFAQWKKTGVNQVVLDLRYNGGGQIAVAEKLASLLAGTQVTNQVFAKFNYNRTHSNWNESWQFNSYANALNLSQVVVITSSKTCSASELLVNALRPYVPVVTVGSATCGKPVGMIGIDVCDKVLYPISFSLTNSLNQGDYYAGIAPTCAAVDDLTTPLGNPAESSLATALAYINTQTCRSGLAKRSLANADAAPLVPANLSDNSGWQQQIGAW